MLLNDNYYVSERRSSNYPVPHEEADTLFVPIDVIEEDGFFVFREYRLSLPISYALPCEIQGILAESLRDFSRKIKCVTIEREEKEGYHYEAEYSPEGVTYHLVKDAVVEIQKGTYDNPIYFVSGMDVTDGLYYIDDEAVIYVCIKDGAAETLSDTSMFLPC